MTVRADDSVPVLARPSRAPVVDSEPTSASQIPRSLTLLSAPTRARRAAVQCRLDDPGRSRDPFELSDGLALDIAESVRRARPDISDEELEATLAGFERVSRNAHDRAVLAQKADATVSPMASLAHRLSGVEAALDDLAGASAQARPEAIARLARATDGLEPVLHAQGLDDAWRADVIENPGPVREVVARAIHATGFDRDRAAQVRRDREGHEDLQVRSEASELWRQTFDETNSDAPDNFDDLARQAIAEGSDPERE